jgi:hypothetical protein
MSSRCAGCSFVNCCGANTNSKLSIVVVSLTPPQSFLTALLELLISKPNPSPFDLETLARNHSSKNLDLSTEKDDILGVLNSQICEHRETLSAEKSSRQLVNAT